MSTYVKKKNCPHCNSTYSYERRTSGKRYMASYGSPIRQCFKCKQYFVDKDYREIAVQGFRKVDTLPISYSAMICTVFLAFIAIYAIGAGSFFGAFIFGGLGVGVVCRDYSGHEERQQILEQEKRQSEERMKNPIYAAALEKSGYHVPECYLPTNVSEDK